MELDDLHAEVAGLKDAAGARDGPQDSGAEPGRGGHNAQQEVEDLRAAVSLGERRGAGVLWAPGDWGTLRG